MMMLIGKLEALTMASMVRSMSVMMPSVRMSRTYKHIKDVHFYVIIVIV